MRIALHHISLTCFLSFFYSLFAMLTISFLLFLLKDPSFIPFSPFFFIFRVLLLSASTPLDPLDPTAEPSGLKSPSHQRHWAIGSARATSLGSVTPRYDDRVEPFHLWLLMRPATIWPSHPGLSTLSFPVLKRILVDEASLQPAATTHRRQL